MLTQYTLGIILLVLIAFDLVLTFLVVRAGGYEENSLLTRFDAFLRARGFGPWVWLVLAKLFCVAVILFAFERRTLTPRGMLTFEIVALVYVAVVVHNWRAWRKQLAIDAAKASP